MISGHYSSGKDFQSDRARADRVPIGIEFLAPPFSERQLLQITYVLEQATHANHRNPYRR
jgi:Asp-tRNA(Asn)/Glu-tRNA(Gln) amidotransferase A subunit family amidase